MYFFKWACSVLFDCYIYIIYIHLVLAHSTLPSPIVCTVSGCKATLNWNTIEFYHYFFVQCFELFSSLIFFFFLNWGGGGTEYGAMYNSPHYYYDCLSKCFCR